MRICKRVIICLMVFLTVFQAQSASALARQDAPDDLSRGLETDPKPMAHGQNPLALEGLSDEAWQEIKNQIESDHPITYLKASNPDAQDHFGKPVAISGDTIVVGAPGEDSGTASNQGDNSANGAGAAYVFTRNSQGTWNQQAYLKASNADAGDYFGISVAISGDTIVVGAYREDSSATGVNGNQQDNSAKDAGAAYVFTRDSQGIWNQQAYLKASNTDAYDEFGISVAISGDTIVVGAIWEDSSTASNQGDNSANGAGAAYVFTRNSQGTWNQQAYLKASNADAGDYFGNSVAISGNTLVVGAYWEDSSTASNQGDNSANGAGAAYVFTRNSQGTWNQQAYLKASNAEAADCFGNSVAISGNTLVVGAHWEDSSTTGVNGNQQDNNKTDAGAAYVFTRDGQGTWSQQAYLKASNTDVWDWFGFSVAISGDTIVVGADQEDSNAIGVNGNQQDNSAENAGAAYVFMRDSQGTWSQQAYLKASNAEAADYFGNSVAISGDTIVVGAPQEDSSTVSNPQDNSRSSAGAAYVYDLVEDNLHLYLPMIIR